MVKIHLDFIFLFSPIHLAIIQNFLPSTSNWRNYFLRLHFQKEKREYEAGAWHTHMHASTCDPNDAHNSLPQILLQWAMSMIETKNGLCKCVNTQTKDNGWTNEKRITFSKHNGTKKKRCSTFHPSIHCLSTFSFFISFIFGPNHRLA